MTPTATAATNCSRGPLAALADDCFVIDVRSEFAPATARFRS
jgi:hypothetical protein